MHELIVRNRSSRSEPNVPGRAAIARLAALAFAVALAAFAPPPAAAQQSGQKTFSSPEAAADALIAAAEKNDSAAMLEILGPDGKEIVSSGDEVQDAQNRANLVRRYQQMHRFVKEPVGTVMYLGAENWPCPIPLIQKDGKWFYDTAAGKMEILYRRVGRNEMSAIKISEELAAAQKTYYASEHNQYAQKIVSDEGQHNGLYWKAAPGEPESPIGPLVAQARAEGYKKHTDSNPKPYRGYVFRVLDEQGKDAPGGAKKYIADGKMTEGFAFIAYPAQYRSSGVMTFIVGADGVVYEKDLGNKTATIAASMKRYNPNSSWKKAVEPTETAQEKK